MGFLLFHRARLVILVTAVVAADEPCLNISDTDCTQYVLGGEGEMVRPECYPQLLPRASLTLSCVCLQWGESVDASDLSQTVWPRLAAVAERLWSPRNTTDADSALPRIEAFRCLLNRRGVWAAPVTNAVARSAPHGPGSCYDQR